MDDTCIDMHPQTAAEREEEREREKRRGNEGIGYERREGRGEERKGEDRSCQMWLRGEARRGAVDATPDGQVPIALRTASHETMGPQRCNEARREEARAHLDVGERAVVITHHFLHRRRIAHHLAHLPQHRRVVQHVAHLRVPLCTRTRVTHTYILYICIHKSTM